MAKSTPRIGFLGAGQMATALTKGFLKNGGFTTDDLLAADPQDSAQSRYFKATNVTALDNNVDVVLGCEVIILAVKPQVLSSVMEEIREHLTPDHLVISIVAGVPMAKLHEGLGDDVRLIRVMPNTSCLIAQGASAFCISEMLPKPTWN